MAETSNSERREPKSRQTSAGRRTRAGVAGVRGKTQAKQSEASRLTPLVIAGASVGVAAIAALALAAAKNRKRSRRAKPEGPSFVGTLVRTTAISAARVLTTHFIQSKFAPHLPASAHHAHESAV